MPFVPKIAIHIFTLLFGRWAPLSQRYYFRVNSPLLEVLELQISWKEVFCRDCGWEALGLLEPGCQGLLGRDEEDFVFGVVSRRANLQLVDEEGDGPLGVLATNLQQV